MMTVFCKLTVTGPPPQIERVRLVLGRPGSFAHRKYLPNGMLSIGFSNRDAPALMLANIVYPPRGGDTEAKYRESWDNAKSWNQANWGCREEVTYDRLVSASPGVLVYRFQTSSFVPHKAFAELSSKFTFSSFTLDSSFLPGGGSRNLYENGFRTPGVAWEAPTSHRAFEKLRGDRTCPCYAQGTLKNQLPYFDCPQGMVSTNQAVSAMDGAL